MIRDARYYRFQISDIGWSLLHTFTVILTGVDDVLCYVEMENAAEGLRRASALKISNKQAKKHNLSFVFWFYQYIFLLFLSFVCRLLVIQGSMTTCLSHYFRFLYDN